MIRIIVSILALFTVVSCTNPIEEIQSEDNLTRIRAVSQLAEDASQSQLDQLIRLLETAGDNGVRASCADVLGYARCTDAVPAIVTALKEPEWRLRRSTARALGQIADLRAVDPLIAVLREDIADPNLSEGRLCAIYAFENMKSEKVVPVLLQMLADNPGRDESERIDYTTALLTVLGAQKDKRSIPALSGFLDGPAGYQAAGAIGKIVDVDFTDPGTQFRMPLPSPAKARAWLQRHPELH